MTQIEKDRRMLNYLDKFNSKFHHSFFDQKLFHPAWLSFIQKNMIAENHIYLKKNNNFNHQLF